MKQSPFRKKPMTNWNKSKAFPEFLLRRRSYNIKHILFLHSVMAICKKRRLLAESVVSSVILWSNAYRTGVSLHFMKRETEGEESVETCQALSSKSHVCWNKALWRPSEWILVSWNKTSRTFAFSFLCCVEWFHSASHRLQEEQNQSDGTSVETRSVHSGCDWGTTQVLFLFFLLW